MKRNKYSTKGNALAQYGIIIILIALALIPVFFVTGKYIFGYFDSFYQTIKTNNVSNTKTSNNSNNENTKVSNNNASTTLTDNDVINGNIKAGQLGGTSEKPEFKCAGEVCTIDYGDFILNGVPSDFSEEVQSSGTSGGTEKLVTLIDQIIAQINQLNPPLDSIYTKDLSNQGHSLGKNQKNLEELVSTMQPLTDISASFGTTLIEAISQSKEKTALTATNFSKLHDELINKYPNPTKSQRNLIKTVDYLSKQIETAQGEVNTKVDNFLSFYQEQKTLLDEANKTGKSLIKGKAFDEYEKKNTEMLEKYSTQYQYQKTHLKSGIICATGHGIDTGIKCN